jgi:hypothetical protein
MTDATCFDVAEARTEPQDLAEDARRLVDVSRHWSDVRAGSSRIRAGGDVAYGWAAVSEIRWDEPTDTQLGLTKVPALLLRRTQAGVIVADPVGAAWGAGASVSEAFAEWQELANEHFGDLRANEARLHPRMRRQLEFLRAVLG